MRLKPILLLATIGIIFSFFPSMANAADEAKVVPYLLPCVGQEVRCIENLVAVKPDGTRINARQTGRIINQGPSSDPYFKYIQGPNVEWEFPGLVFQNGTGRVFLRSYYWPAGNKHCWADGNCSINEEEWGIYMAPNDMDSVRPAVILNSKDAAIVCPSTPTYCNIGTPPWKFDLDITFEINIRMASDFKPLYTQGRVKNFALHQLSSSANEYNNYQVKFSPLVLPNVAYNISDLKLIDQSLYETDMGVIWIYGMNNSKSKSLGQCGTIGGLDVVTNAYSMWNPVWNPASGTLDVQLQSPHLDVKGEPSKGYLEVQVPIEMAKCLWGVDISGEVTAKFSLLYSGQTTPEVITITSKVSQGNYQMIAAGFHFSSPTIQVKLLKTPEQKVEVPAPIATELPSAKTVGSKVSKSITCKKGKTQKVVKGLTPKCPVGYTLKK